MTHAGDVIKEIMRKLEPKQWTKCPLCHEQWNKLRPCRYFLNGQINVENVCVTCAESPKSIRQVFKKLGLDVYFHDRIRKKPYDNLAMTYREKGEDGNWSGTFDHDRGFIVQVENIKPLVNVRFYSDSNRMWAEHLEAKSTSGFDNIFQAVAYFASIVDEQKKLGDKPKKSSWGDL